MGDPLSTTASVIAVATLAWQGSKKAYELLDGIREAPKAISHSKSLLSETENTLKTLRSTLLAGSESSGALDSVLQTIKLDVSLKSTLSLCDRFGEMVEDLTHHSTNSRFSYRDRLVVSFRESSINRLNSQLGECQRTISLVLVSINLIVSSRTSDDVQALSGRFTAQETALSDLAGQLRDTDTGLRAIPLDDSGYERGERCSTAERDSGLQLVEGLRGVCKATLSATRAKRTGQNFGDLQTDDNSKAFQGIVGTAQSGLEQSFGRLTATKNSTAAQGQMDAASFAILFGNR